MRKNRTNNQPVRKANDCANKLFNQSETLLSDRTSEYRARSAPLCKKKQTNKQTNKEKKRKQNRTSKLEEEAPKFAFFEETIEHFTGKQENKGTRATTNLQRKVELRKVTKDTSCLTQRIATRGRHHCQSQRLA